MSSQCVNHYAILPCIAGAGERVDEEDQEGGLQHRQADQWHQEGGNEGIHRVVLLDKVV